MRDINWAVLGTGVIANEMAVALKKNGKSIYAVGNRTYEKAVAFGEKYGIGKVYTDYNEMFTDRDVDVIYITTPHNTHKKFMKQAIENGKHILVEKSITLHSKQPKRGMISCEKGYIEIMEYPRAWEARITYVETGDVDVIRAGENADALAYELEDMEKAIAGDSECMHFDYTKDVMDMMTEFRKAWKFTYPEEE